MTYAIKQSMKEEVRTAIKENDETLENIRDNSHEWVDGYLPIYNNEIIEQWQLMPGDYDDRGSTEMGHMGENTIIGLMSLDLYIYYTELFTEVMDELEEEEAN